MSENGIVQKLASLARVRVEDDRAQAFEKEFESILAYIGQLDALSLSIDATPATPAVRNVTREDGSPTDPGTWTERLVRMFPKRSGNALSVKKIISHD